MLQLFADDQLKSQLISKNNFFPSCLKGVQIGEIFEKDANVLELLEN